MAAEIPYLEQFTKVFSRYPQISNIKPSEWAEKNIVIPGGKGRLNYDFNPYCREIINLFAPDHPMRKCVVMKGSQITFSSGVLMPLLGFIIAEDPHNSLFMVGDTKLLVPANEKLDFMITNATTGNGMPLRDLISDQSNRKRKTKSGDTDTVKYFPGGWILTDSLTNSKAIAQIDCERIILDDADAIKKNDPKTGAFLDLVEMRGAANYHTFKMAMIGTPLLKGESNLEPNFLLYDQRYYNIECPHCHEPITWKFRQEETIHFVWKLDNHNNLIKNSVEYICPKCGCAHNDRNKQKQLQGGLWVPTSTSISEECYSYHISSLYAPVGMNPWHYYIQKWIEANPKDRPRDEFKYQTLVNTGFGETYEPQAESPEAKDIQKNQREYPIGIIPSRLSQKDGNGKIVLLTCEADINGTVSGVNGATKNDARLDYEIVAWSESGASYSVQHGSIGTFIPYEGTTKSDRYLWTYEHNKPNSVWPVFWDIISRAYISDEGLYYYINKPGVDVGAYAHLVEPFIDWTIGQNPGNPCVGMRGKKEESYLREKQNVSRFEVGRIRNDVFFLQVGLYKDDLSDKMKSKWDKEKEVQPSGFMNFPMSERYVCPVKAKHYARLGWQYNGDLLYQTDSYFAHYESEHRKQVQLKDGGSAFRWVKKKSNSQNHFFDCRIYNMAKREIIVATLKHELGNKVAPEFAWPDYVKYVLG